MKYTVKTPKLAALIRTDPDFKTAIRQALAEMSSDRLMQILAGVDGVLSPMDCFADTFVSGEKPVVDDQYCIWVGRFCEMYGKKIGPPANPET